MDISNWPPLVAGECIQLPILSTIFQTYIPSLTSANLQQVHTQQFTNSPDKRTHTEDDSRIVSESVIKYGKSETDSECGECRSNENGDEPENDEKALNRTELSRDDILESYKQSKEMLLTSKMNAMKLAHCSKDSINESNCDECESDDVNDDDSFSDMKTANSLSYESDAISIDSKTMAMPRQMVPSSSASRTPFVLSSVQEIDLFRSLYTVLSYTHLLWELVLTAEPIVVMATSPSDCSHMVQSLMRFVPDVGTRFTVQFNPLSICSIIAPLSYSAEARPYFTIHDSEFKEFTQQQGSKPIILGVTNPFFSKTLQHWPHLIRLPDGNNGTALSFSYSTLQS